VIYQVRSVDDFLPTGMATDSKVDDDEEGNQAKVEKF
jgi:hypothetical protein